jgi:hypothetical protein
MKRLTFLAVAMMFVLGFSSCLKDTPFMDVSNTQPIIEFGQSAANGVYGVDNLPVFLYGSDTTITYDTTVALILASPQVLNDTVATEIIVDTTQIAPYNAAAGDSTTLLPDSLYSLASTSIPIWPQHRIGSIQVVLNFQKFPAHYDYCLPLSIVNAIDRQNANNLIIVSGNSGKFMWLFQQ